MNIQELSEREREQLREQLGTKEVLTQSELAFLYGTTRQTIFAMRKAGLPFYRLNTQIRFKRSEVERFMRRDNRAAAAA